MRNLLDYEKLVRVIKELSMTQLLGLFVTITEECLRKGCFKSGGVSNTIKRIENIIALERGEVEPNLEIKPKIVRLTCSVCNTSFTLDENNIHRRCGLSGCVGILHLLAG